jgi:hypothetical protein
MNRTVQPELLDVMPPEDPRAMRSRRDLRRINAWMRNHAIMARALRTAVNGSPPAGITDLGAGDGFFLVHVAKKVASRWPGVRVTLVDKKSVVTLQTLSAFSLLGWRAEAVVADVYDWLSAAAGLDIVVANLFLHHFDEAKLVELLRAVAGRARLFVAIEPRRAPWALLCCRWLWVIGCNSVTRYDAAVSVRAGFSGRELSALWPAGSGWRLVERRTGFFSHLFVAQRRD